MPTPTPRPSLSFTYGDYSAASVGVSFKAPAGWLVDESQAQTFILREPESQIKDGQQCVITITAQTVTSNYNQSDPGIAGSRSGWISSAVPAIFPPLSPAIPPPVT